MLTVKDLVGALELELVAGERSAAAPIRWVHVSELEDPTPWLSGGELLLSTGMQLLDEDSQRAYVHQLVEHHLAGLGFGVGFAHERCPPRCSMRPAHSSSPCSACPTRCRSSRSRSEPSRAWSTNSSTCSSGRSRFSGGWNASCLTRVALPRSCAGSRTRSARPCSSSTGGTDARLARVPARARREPRGGDRSGGRGAACPHRRARRVRPPDLGAGRARDRAAGARRTERHRDLVARRRARGRQRRGLRALPGPPRGDGGGARPDARTCGRRDRTPPRR